MFEFGRVGSSGRVRVSGCIERGEEGFYDLGDYFLKSREDLEYRYYFYKGFYRFVCF